MKDKRTYSSWASMKERCNNPNSTCYHKYGARGIKVCKRWATFNKFFEDMGLRPKGKTLDRINNDGDYKPSNCKWSTPLEQSNNQRPKHNLIPERKCLICGVLFKPNARQQAGKYCSRLCYFESMIGQPARNKDGTRNLKQYQENNMFSSSNRGNDE